MHSTILFSLLAGPITLAAPSATPKFTFYETPTSFSGPCDLDTGPDGAIWVSDQLVNKLARVDVTTGAVTDYPIPWTLPPLAENPLAGLAGGRLNLACVVRSGADGHLYAANGLRNQLVKMNVTTKDIEVLTPPGLGPAGNLQPFNDAYTAEDGIYFTQTTGNVLTFYEFETGEFTNYEVPTPAAMPLGVLHASDGNVYVAEFMGNKIAKFDTGTKTFTEFVIPVPLQGPSVVRAETEGRYIWITGLTGNSLVRYDMETDTVDVVTNPTLLSFPTEDTVDGKGNVWFSNFFQNTISYYTPGTKMFTKIDIPDSVLNVPVGVPPGVNIAIHYGPSDAIWFTQEVYNRVGRYALS
ncbi:MAG: hypothetical protein MMC23_002466 [Stictis urceolatum]|nr:hypothetical protein [Stictis urceolata]